jgi:hypothetical protein
VQCAAFVVWHLVPFVVVR